MKIKIRPSQDGLKLVPSWFPLITSCLFLLLPACFPPFCSYFLLVSNTSCLCPSCSYQLPQVPNVSSVLLLTFFLILVSFLYFFSNCSGAWLSPAFFFSFVLSSVFVSSVKNQNAQGYLMVSGLPCSWTLLCIIWNKYLIGNICTLIWRKKTCRTGGKNKTINNFLCL